VCVCVSSVQSTSDGARITGTIVCLIYQQSYYVVTRFHSNDLEDDADDLDNVGSRRLSSCCPQLFMCEQSNLRRLFFVSFMLSTK